MRARDWFTVGFRLLGVWMLICAVDELALGGEIQLHLLDVSRTSSLGYLFHAVVDIAAAVALLRCQISLFWPDGDPQDPGFEVIQVPEKSAAEIDEKA